MTIKTPFGVDGTVTMRAEDNTLINYIIGYGVSLLEGSLRRGLPDLGLGADPRAREAVEEEAGLP